MIAVLEGPDGGGKSTLARTLQDRYSADYLHAGPPPQGATPASLTRLYAAMVCHTAADDYDDESGRAASRLDSAIIDRWALGETVYGPLFRGKSLIGRTEWTALSSLLDATSTPLILCLPPKHVAIDTWRGRLDQERFKDPLAVSKVYDAYATYAYGGNAALRSCRWQWAYDYTEAGALDKLLAYLDTLAEKQR